MFNSTRFHRFPMISYTILLDMRSDSYRRDVACVALHVLHLLRIRTLHRIVEKPPLSHFQCAISNLQSRLAKHRIPFTGRSEKLKHASIPRNLFVGPLWIRQF